MLELLDDLLRFAYSVYEFFWHWRFNLCLAIGIIGAVAAYKLIDHHWLEMAAFLTILTGAVILGWRWDRSA